jgi:uncharacterized protein YfaT (DUF1175 family)
MKQQPKAPKTAWIMILASGLLILLLLARLALFASRSPSSTRAAHPGHTRSEAAAAEPVYLWSDSYNDGTPYFLRLRDLRDQEAFRGWFTAIAEFEAMRPSAEVPKEISDCAGLLRYCYREALKRHNEGWFAATGMSGMRLPGEIRAWHYPETPLGAALFRVTPGSLDGADPSAGFAQFADAKTLVERNTFLVGRDLRQARPGDLLFYRQFGQSSPWHSMILVEINGGLGVIYHTGPMGHGEDARPGEIRRVRMEELLHHPRAEWRPVNSNPDFLGIYRWNILRSG